MGKAAKKTILLCGGEGAGKTTLVRLMKLLEDAKSNESTQKGKNEDADENGSSKKEEELVVSSSGKNLKEWNHLRAVKPSQGLDIHKINYQGSKIKVWDISGKTSVGFDDPRWDSCVAKSTLA